ncbi:hypothetical protein [Bradyrhizobium guangzhouense]|uniref:Uncharacterized protein n=1 Tax=Bradyrhizobium guangzhouense TaxID=1325095 RepID=A0AAE6C686_9BRAD|nr:hypothetical protein [Bradyrhizobium guangzhouense]QAU44201.1 hypothetical protein XH91_01735 [Bradyrhizobium guangzhouense]
MNDVEMKAKLAVLEVVAMNTLAIVFAITASSDPNNRMAISAMDTIRSVAKRRMSGTIHEAEVLRAGEAYLDELLSDLSENLASIRVGKF